MIYIPQEIKNIIGEEAFKIDSTGMSAATVIMFPKEVLKISDIGEEADREEDKVLHSAG